MATDQDLSQPIIDQFVGTAHGDFGRVQELLAQHPALLNASSTVNETALGAAAQMGRRDIAEFLLAAGAPLDICAASMLGSRDRVAAMLRADPDLAQATGAHNLPALYYPAISDEVAIAELLLAHGAAVNASGGSATALHGAAMFGRRTMTVWLLAHDAEVNARDYAGRTPLRLALDRGCAEVAELLRQHGGAED